MSPTSLAVLSVLTIGTSMSPDARARYTQASQDIQARAYGPAIEKLNALAAEYPRVAEIFASRCSALIANAQYERAEADCTYALSIKPLQPEALYALAVAEDHQSKRAAAAEHYRKYASLDGVPFQSQAQQRADILAGNVAPPLVDGANAGGWSRLTIYRNHRMAGAGPFQLIVDGHVLGDVQYGQYVDLEMAPGSHVIEARTRAYDAFEIPRVWTHPIQLNAGSTSFINFDTNGGQIVMQELPGGQARQEIRDDCTKGWSLRGPFDNLPLAGPAQAQVPAVVVPGYGYGYAAPAPAPQCHMGSNGMNTCGYNCEFGSNGRWYCSSIPNGRCAFNSNGTWSCP
jgi:hypothetical protein